MKFNVITVVGLFLVVVGALAFAIGGIQYTTEEEILDVGPIEATAETRETLPLSPLFGGIAIVSGIVLVVIGARGPGGRG